MQLVVCPTGPRLFIQKKSPCPSMVHSTQRLYITEGWEQKNSLIHPLPLVSLCLKKPKFCPLTGPQTCLIWWNLSVAFGSYWSEVLSILWLTSFSQNWNLFSIPEPCRFYLLKFSPLFCLLCICTVTAFVQLSVISSCESVHCHPPHPTAPTNALLVSCSCVSPIQSPHSSSRTDLSTTFIYSSHSPT